MTCPHLNIRPPTKCHWPFSHTGIDCPSGYNKSSGSSCYKFGNSEVSHSEARSQCDGDSSHLVFIETSEENDFLIRETINNTQYWIGLHDEPHLFWNNGNHVAFANIDLGDSYTFNQRTGCYRMSNVEARYWLDNYCFKAYGYICEYEA